MSLVSNFIGGISGISLGNNTVTPNFDLNDTTFSELLEKQLNTTDKTEGLSNSLGTLGIPAGLQIDGMNGAEFTETAFDQAEALGAKTDAEKSEEENQTNNIIDLNNDGDVTSSEIRTFFGSLLDGGSTGQEARSELFDFAKKQAANLYDKYSKNVVTNLNDFVSDVKELIS